MNVCNYLDLILKGIKKYFITHRFMKSGLVRFTLRVIDEFRKDKCLIRASSLSYTTLLALIPLTALSFSLFTAFDTFSGVKESVQRSMVNLLVPTRQDQLILYIDKFLNNTKTMGIVGLLFFTITSIMLLNRISESFNSIWGSTNRRNFIGKFTSYTAIIVFGTLLIGTSFTITVPIRNFLESFPEIRFIVRWVIELAPSIFIFFTFLLMITAIPAGKVKLKSSMPGAFIGTILWGFARGAFTEGASNVIQMSKIYGSLAVVPIFLFWLYIIWIIVFLALEISYVHQHGKNWEKRNLTSNYGPAESILQGLEVFLIIAGKFHNGKEYPSADDISSELSIPLNRIHGIVEKFSKERLILNTDENSEKILPSRSLNKILISDVIKAVSGQIDSQISGSAYTTINNFFNAGYNTIETNTIEDLIHK